MTKMEILLKITPAVSIVRKLTPKMEEVVVEHLHKLNYLILCFSYYDIPGKIKYLVYLPVVK